MLAYLTVPLNPAAALGALTSPVPVVYCLANPKSNIYTFLQLYGSLPMEKLL